VHAEHRYIFRVSFGYHLNPGVRFCGLCTAAQLQDVSQDLVRLVMWRGRGRGRGWVNPNAYQGENQFSGYSSRGGGTFRGRGRGRGRGRAQDDGTLFVPQVGTMNNISQRASVPHCMQSHLQAWDLQAHSPNAGMVQLEMCTKALLSSGTWSQTLRTQYAPATLIFPFLTARQVHYSVMKGFSMCWGTGH
jgi:hypothetical protein